MLRRSLISGAIAVTMLSLAACKPVTVMVDTPKEGDKIAVNVKQDVQVRWANLQPDNGNWVLETPPKGALAAGGSKIQPAAAGAQQLEIFSFTGASKGAESLTFAFQHKDGSPTTPEERITIHANVS